MKTMRCEPGEGKHVFDGVGCKCDCGKHTWPPSNATFTIPEGEMWRVDALAKVEGQ